MESTAPRLLTLLSNESFLLATTPYLLPTELYALSLVSRSFYSLISHSRSVWRHLDLTHKPGPAKNIPDATALLSRPAVIRDVKTLILDRETIDSDFLETLLYKPYQLQLLSIRDCIFSDPPRLLVQLQNRLIAGGQTLKGIYLFTSPDDDETSATEARSASSNITRALQNTYAEILTQRDSVLFDAVLCGGPLHREEGAQPRIAQEQLEGPCAGCGGGSGNPDNAVVLPPVPLFGGIKTARGRLEARCRACLRDRRCEKCRRWWCEACDVPGKKHAAFDCYECGALCNECAVSTYRICKSCNGRYCLQHDDGADDIRCEWCNSSERRNRQFDVESTSISMERARAMTLARINMLRSSIAVNGRNFQEEVIARKRCLITS